MPVFHWRVPVINSLATAARINHGTGVAVVTVQALVALNTSYPDDRVVDPVSRGDPR